MYEKICRECGTKFTAAVNNTKFCQACRKAVYKKNKQKHKVFLLNDSEAMRQACLNCRRPRCGGECEELARVARGEA